MLFAAVTVAAHTPSHLLVCAAVCVVAKTAAVSVTPLRLIVCALLSVGRSACTQLEKVVVAAAADFGVCC